MYKTVFFSQHQFGRKSVIGYVGKMEYHTPYQRSIRKKKRYYFK